MTEKKVDVIQRYSREIQDIANKLSDLEQGRIYELTKARMDGYLSNNITGLRRMITGLIVKIENGNESIYDRLAEIFRVRIRVDSIIIIDGVCKEEVNRL